MQKASKLYKQSNANEVNKGILNIKNGNYSSAADQLNGSGYNAILAKTMNGDNSTFTKDNLPKDLGVRADLNKRFKKNGIITLQNELKKLDPAHYKNIDIHNPQRIIRSLEVCIITGKPYSSFLSNSTKKRSFSNLKFLLFSILLLLLAFTAKHIRGFISLKLFLKLIIFSLILFNE